MTGGIVLNKKYIAQAMGCFVGSLFFATSVHAQVIGTINSSSLAGKLSQATASVQASSNMKGQEVHILGTKGEWFEVSYNGEKTMIKKDSIDYKGALGTINQDVNFRDDNELSKDNIQGQLQKGTQVHVLAVEGNFALISHSNKYGYIHASRLNISKADLQLIKEVDAKKVARVTVDTLNVRQQTNVSSPILTKVKKGDKLHIVTATDQWVQILTNDGIDGYVMKKYVQFDEFIDTDNIAGLKSQGEEIVEKAKQYLGRPYVFGGTSLTTGIDCSAYTQAIYRFFDINISRTSRTQINDGTRVSRNELKPGDLVFYGTSKNYISHCGIYMGDGQVIHASSPKTGIIISTLDKAGRYYIGATRILK